MIKLRYIYEIKNLVNGKTYIGKRDCPKNCNPVDDTYFGSGMLLWGHYENISGQISWMKGGGAFDKYGQKNFKKTIVVEGNFTKKEIDEYERYYITLYKMNGKAEYNLTKGGTGRKVDSAVFKGAKWYNNGIKEILARECPEGFIPGFLKIRKWAKINFGGTWYTNGQNDILCFKCPDGYWKGKTNNLPPKHKGKKWFEKDGETKLFFEGMEPNEWKKSNRNTFPSLKNTCQYTNGKNTRMCREGEQPDGWYKGNSHIKGTHYYNNGKIDIMCKEGEQPEGFIRGRMFKTQINKRWYNNGTENRLCKPDNKPEGWKLGKIHRKKN